MSRARRSDEDSTPVRRGAATPPSAFSRARVSGPPFYGPSEPEKCRGQGAATKTVRQYGEELQRRHRHFLGLASLARHFTDQANLKNVEGKAQRRTQYAWSARSCNAAIGIFSGSRLWHAIINGIGYLIASAKSPPTSSTDYDNARSTPRSLPNRHARRAPAGCSGPTRTACCVSSRRAPCSGSTGMSRCARRW